MSEKRGENLAYPTTRVCANVLRMPEDEQLAVVSLTTKHVDIVRRVASAQHRTPGQQLSFVVANWAKRTEKTLSRSTDPRPEPTAA